MSDSGYICIEHAMVRRSAVNLPAAVRIYSSYRAGAIGGVERLPS